MASRTSSATYAASSDATLNFSQISVTETDTDTNAVPNFSKVAGFLPGAGGKATAPVTGAIAAAPTYDGLTWASFNAGVYAGCSMSLTFSYTVSAVDPTMGISALQQLFTTDYLSVPAGVSIVATETASSNGQQVGQFSVALDAGGQSSQPSSYALPTAYQSLQISVTYTMAASTVSAATGVDVSRIIQGFQTAPVTTGSIGDFVWNDLNGNGIYDTNESAMSGVTVDLLDANGGSFGVTTTDTTGHYLFSSLNAGTYQVQFVAPTLYSFTTQVAGSGTQTVSAANVATGRTGLITLSAGQNILVEDAGLVIGLSGGGGGMIPLISIDEQIVVNGQTFEAGNGVLTPYPTVLAGSTLTEQDIVTNTGTVALSNVVVTDSQGRRITVGSLAAGASYTIAPSETVTAVNNVLSTDTATATGTYTDNLGRTTTVSATDSVDYLGVSASVALDKQISTDGTNWVDAGTGNLTQNPGVLVGATLYERVIVTNTGAVALSHLTVSDVGGNGPASFAVGSTLAIGASETSAVAIVTAASGYQLDTATVTGTGTDNVGQTTTVTASDQANYTGIPLNPDVSILKTVTSVGGVAGNPAVTYAGEVITYNIVVTNTGNVTLTNVVVTDPTLGTTLDTLPSLAPGASKTYIASQVATQTQINNANASVRIYAASGTGADGAENAAATITIKNDQIIIVLSSGQVNPTGAGQEVSGIRFTLGNTPISASLTSASGTLIDIVAGGTVTSHAGVIDHWGVAQSGATLTLATAGAGSVGGKPTDLIIGPGPYTNANPSITGRDPQIQGPATFILSAPGVTLGTTITSVGIEFGTGPDNVLTATQTGSTVGGAITNTAKVTDDQTGAKFSTASTAIAGGYTPAIFTTHVYYDTNKDGVQNTGTNSTETNLAGVTVTLLTGTGASTGKTAITNSAGNVSFVGLAPGSYEVAVTTPAGDVVTKAINVGTPNTLVAGGSATAFEGVVASTPGITVDKTAAVNAVNAAAGFSTVTYTYKVTNTGNTALNNIKLVDNHGTSLLPDNMSPVSVLATCSQYNVGDANRNGVLDVGESWTYQAKIIETGNYVGNPSISATTSISGCSTQGGETIWLSSVLKSYQTTDGTSYAFKGVTANVHLANGTNQSYSVPDSYVTFSSACTSPTTTWDAVQHAWITTLKAGSSVGNVFMTGVPITVPAGTNMNGATVSMTVNTAVSSNGATAPSWAISTSAYDNFKTSTGDDASHDYSKIGVKSSDNGATNYTGNSSYDKAGTPGETEDNHGGSNYSANYGWHYSSDDYGRGTYTWGRSGYSSNFGGSTNTGSTGYSATTTMHMTALSDSTVIDNVTVSAQTICPTGYGGGSYSGSGGDDGYRGGYYGNGSSGDDGRYRNGSYGAGERDDGGDYNNGTGSYGGSSSYSNYNTSSYGSWGDHSYSYGSYYTWGDYGSCSSYSSSYNYGSSYYGSSSSSDGKITWDSARSVWTDDKSSSTGYYGSGIDDREVTSGGDKVGLEDDYSKSCGTNGGTTTTPSGCVVTTVTGSDMQNVQVLATTNIQLGGIATTAELKTAYGAATKLEFTYSPSDVVSASNLQNGIATANGHNTDSLAFIEVSNSSNPFATGAKLYFAGTVGTGAKFIADATVDINNNLLPVGTFGNLYTFIFADQNNFNAHAAPIQTIVYDATGGNGGMHINDQIGSIKLAGYVGTTGHGYLAA